jgi:hypothetical protein
MKTRNSKAGRGGWAAGFLTIGLSLLTMAVIAVSGCATIQSIAVTPAKTVFAQGEKFSYEGIQVTGITKKGETKDISSDSMVMGYDPDRIGEQRITVEYRNITTTYTVTVVGVEGITIDAAPDIARQGLDIDRSALRLSASYGDKLASRPVQGSDPGVNITGYNKDALGAQTVTAEYYGKTATFAVTVAPLTGIKITKPPVKTTYFNGEPLDLAGIEATAAWQDAGEAPVTPEYVSGFDSNTQGDQTVIVEALGKQASFIVTVKEPTDPDKWTPAQGTFAKNIAAIVYGNGTFVALGYDDKPDVKIIGYSADGIVWTKTPSQATSAFPKNIIGLVYGNRAFVVAGYENDKNDGYVSDKINESVILYSTDGVTWTKAATPEYFRNKKIFFGNGKFIVIGDYRYQQTGTSQWVSNYYLVESSDGINWSDRIIPSFGGWEQGVYKAATVSDNVWNSVRYVFSDDSKFIALYENTYLYSTDKLNAWRPGEGSVDINGRPIDKAVFGSGKFVGVGGETVGWSIDGITWTDADHKGEELRGGDLNGVAYGFGMFVAVNSRGNIIYSRDGYTWTKVASSTFGSTGIRDVAYGNGRFVAVGENGRIAYSNRVD